MFRLDNRTALVTGGGNGIGRAVAHALAGAGARVVVADLDPVAAAAVAEEIRDAAGSADGTALDVCDEESVRQVVERASAPGGELNILVNCAGIIAPGMATDLESSDFRRVLDVHLFGSFVCSRTAAPTLARDGTARIVNVTSAAGMQGTIGQVNYAAAKAGVIGLTKSLAREFASRAVSVNAIAPLAATSMTAKVRNDERFAPRYLDRIPMRRWADPAEIAAAFVFLCGDGASYITGQVIAVDGGLAM